MHVHHNTLQSERCKDDSSVARWAHTPQSGNSKLFHRWLVIRTDAEHAKHPCVEHVNNILLDYRDENLVRAENA